MSVTAGPPTGPALPWHQSHGDGPLPAPRGRLRHSCFRRTARGIAVSLLATSGGWAKLWRSPVQVAGRRASRPCVCYQSGQRCALTTHSSAQLAQLRANWLLRPPTDPQLRAYCQARAPGPQSLKFGSRFRGASTSRRAEHAQARGLVLSAAGCWSFPGAACPAGWASH